MFVQYLLIHPKCALHKRTDYTYAYIGALCMHTHLTNIFSLLMIYLSPIYPIDIKFYAYFISKLCKYQCRKHFSRAITAPFSLRRHIYMLLFAHRTPRTVRMYYSLITNSDEFEVNYDRFQQFEKYFETCIFFQVFVIELCISQFFSFVFK